MPDRLLIYYTVYHPNIFRRMKVINHQVAMALCVGFIVAVVVGGAALTAPVAQAARTSNDERFVLKATTAACKSEAREKKIRGTARGEDGNELRGKPVKLNT